MRFLDDLPFTTSRLRAAALILPLAAMLAGCAAIPSSGPTGAGLRSQIADDMATLPIDLVAVHSMADLPVTSAPAPVFSGDYTPPASTELVGSYEGARA